MRKIGAISWLNSPKIKPSVYIVTIAAFLYWAVNSDLINLSDKWLAILNIGILAATSLLGISITTLKQVAGEMDAIAKDAKMNTLQKLNAWNQLSIKVNTQVGLAWEAYNLTQPIDSPTQDNKAEMDDIVKRIEALEAELPNDSNT